MVISFTCFQIYLDSLLHLKQEIPLQDHCKKVCFPNGSWLLLLILLLRNLDIQDTILDICNTFTEMV